jgi:hypothetical protein
MENGSMADPITRYGTNLPQNEEIAAFLPTFCYGKCLNKLTIFIGLPWQELYSVRRRLLSPVLKCGFGWDGDQSDHSCEK